MIRRIAITGPESTGKSFLSQALAAHYQTLWVPEYAREYLENLNRSYAFDDIVLIAKEQLQRELRAEKDVDRILFFDTDILVTYIWSIFKYNKCDPWITDRLALKPYDLHLLCDIDLPWEDDPLREHPQRREALFDLYLHELQSRQMEFRIIRGCGEDRTRNAIAAIDSFLQA